MEKLQAEVDAMLAIIAGQTAIISSLIRTHPAYDQLQMDLAGVLEISLNGAAGKTLTEKQRLQARSFVESLQGLHQAHSPIATDLIKKIQRG